MKEVIISIIFLCFMAFEGFSQLQVGGGPAYFLNEKFQEEQKSSLDYTLSVGYAIHKFDVGLEFIQNGYNSFSASKKYYEFYQYQTFGRFYPLKRRTWFLKGGINYSYEKIITTYLDTETSVREIYKEYGRLLGLEGGLGFQDRLIKNTNIFLNISLTYNYLKVIEDRYIYWDNKEKEPFYALKASLIYQFDLKKKTIK